MLVLLKKNYVTMSKMSQMSKLKNNLKSERNNIFENGQMRKVAQNLRNLRKSFRKMGNFLLPSAFTVHANNLGILFHKYGSWMEI